MEINISEMDEKETAEVSELVKAGFDEFVKPDLTEEGIKEFYRAASSFIHERPGNHFVLVASSANKIVGMIDVRDCSHICLFFVSRDFHKKGVGKLLLTKAISKCIAQSGESKNIDVNSSIYAVEAYKRLGFIQTKEEQIINGIKFVPMNLNLEL